MKNLIVSAIIASTSFVASAADVTVSAARDNNLNVNGVAVSTQSLKLGPVNTVSFTHYDGKYDRVSLAHTKQLATVGGVSLAGSAGLEYQMSDFGRDGAGVSLGITAAIPVTKNVTVSTGVSYFKGQSRVSAYNGTSSNVSAQFKF